MPFDAPRVRYRFVRPPTVSRVGRAVDEVERVTPHGAGLAGSLMVLPFDSDALPLTATLSGQPGEDLPELGWSLPPDVQSLSPPVQSPLVEIEDGRKFRSNPEALPSRKRWTSRLLAAKPLSANAVPAGVTPVAKEHVLLCIRRKNRRGSILALGQGGGYHRPPRRSPTSDVWC